MNTTVITEDAVGTWLDSARGHYIIRDVIELAVEFGFIIGPFEQFAVDMYDLQDDFIADFPHEGMQELCDEAVAWLNTGQGECPACDAKGYWSDNIHMICKVCSGSGRGPDRIKGQNFPPKVPEGYVWGFNDGDFGLYPCVIFTIWDADKREQLAEDVPMNEARNILTNAGVPKKNIDQLLDQSPDDLALQFGGFTVEANSIPE